MIISFADKDTENLYYDRLVKRFESFERMARRKLLMLSGIHKVEELYALSGNRLEALKGDRKGQYSIRINNRWRICFRWQDGNAHEVEIVDYH